MRPKHCFTTSLQLRQLNNSIQSKENPELIQSDLPYLSLADNSLLLLILLALFSVVNTYNKNINSAK